MCKQEWAEINGLHTCCESVIDLVQLYSGKGIIKKGKFLLFKLRGLYICLHAENEALTVLLICDINRKRHALPTGQRGTFKPRGRTIVPFHPTSFPVAFANVSFLHLFVSPWGRGEHVFIWLCKPRFELFFVEK